ncbi:hypothetical protein [Vagococcus salmoninarum]|uniref:hypothetical protein n=1 Tax=Vagococcus salmoninarum TaxID=2739 RepID=UPI00187EE4C1|nr:hypothetical protein [Vagococcus salmoninarum]MBE9387852.1 hypothetical protein [Vagococcus salmoninarum]
MFNLFKRAVPEENKNTELIEVSDLKQYVVKAYENEKLNAASAEKDKIRIKELDAKLKAADIEKIVLNEKESEVSRLERGVQTLELRLESLRKEKDENLSQLNSYKIKYRDTEQTIEEIKMQNKKEVLEAVMINNDKLKSRLMQQVESHKGNLSKKIVLDLISNG